MGYFKQELFGIMCDSCGEQHIDSGNDNSAWYDKDDARESALESDWIEDKDKFTCPKCRPDENIR